VGSVCERRGWACVHTANKTRPRHTPVPGNRRAAAPASHRHARTFRRFCRPLMSKAGGMPVRPAGRSSSLPSAGGHTQDGSSEAGHRHQPEVGPRPRRRCRAEARDSRRSGTHENTPPTRPAAPDRRNAAPPLLPRPGCAVSRATSARRGAGYAKQQGGTRPATLGRDVSAARDRDAGREGQGTHACQPWLLRCPLLRRRPKFRGVPRGQPGS
jgi:hypothetical protein